MKYALNNGYALVPAYCFGESGTYSNLQGAWKFRMWLNGFGLPAIVPFGKWPAVAACVRGVLAVLVFVGVCVCVCVCGGGVDRVACVRACVRACVCACVWLWLWLWFWPVSVVPFAMRT